MARRTQRPATHRFADTPEAFIREPPRIGPVTRAWNSMVDRMVHQRFVPGRLMAWDQRTAFSWVAGSLYWLLPAGKARKALGERIQNLVAVTAAYTVGSPYCIADAVESEPTGLTDAELETIRTVADPSVTPSFSRRERLAITYARLVSATPLEFPDGFVSELTEAFTEQEIVILAALAAEVNRNARLFEALGAPPPVYGPA